MQMCFSDVVLKYHPGNPESQTYGCSHITAEMLVRILDELKQAHESEADAAFEEWYGRDSQE